MTDRELMQAVLEAMESLHRTGDTQVFDMYAAPELIPALRERLAQPEGAIIPHLPGICCKTGTCDREQPKMVLLDPEIGKIVFANLDKLYVEDPPAQQPEQQHEAYWLIAPNGTHYKNPKHPMNQEQPEQNGWHTHDLYTDADKDRPDVICDSNGSVTLGLCKRCGRGEVQLYEPCDKQPEQEPVPVYLVEDDFGLFRVTDKADYTYWSSTGRHKTLVANTTPPRREWVGLTKEEAKEISLANRPYVVDMIAALEARLKEKNT